MPERDDDLPACGDPDCPACPRPSDETDADEAIEQFEREEANRRARWDAENVPDRFDLLN
jgi:hypothetical protein